ncbi:MAG: glycosyltransferase [Cytophagales bacterium]|nr:glycosyltransferase [Cytophagales bacterium]MDW8383539.1 glycosyltransferase [Flammeovirgaceae bacterium]
MSLDAFYIGFWIIYSWFTLLLWWGWRCLPEGYGSKRIDSSVYFSVLIVVRNEAKNISQLLEDLVKQSFSNFEVIVIDDNSTDGTLEILKKFSQDSPFSFKILSYVRKKNFVAHKKACIALGISHAKGSYIVTTDGDCRVLPTWLESIAEAISATNAVFISAPVCFGSEQTIFEKMQTIEFASLVGAGAATLAFRRATMCSAANMCYQKKAFYEVNGYEGFEHIPSGDDEFLFHKIAKRYPEKIIYLKEKRAIVTTYPVKTIREFWKQRTRWGGKWTSYQNAVASFTAVFIFVFHFLNLLSLFLLLFNQLSFVVWAFGQSFKTIAEWLFVGSVLNFFSKRHLWILLPLVQIIHSFYIVVVGIGALFVKTNWKN